MIGSKSLVIGPSDWIKGASSSDALSDAGFSPLGDGINPRNVPGVLYAPAAAADADTDNRLSTTISIIATAPDMAAVMSDRRLLVGNNSGQDGTFYRYDGTKIIAAAYATDTTRNYEKGITDIITFAGEAYVTNFSTIARWQNDNTITQDFFTFTTSTVPHPAVVFENNAYYGDKNLLLRQTAAAGTPATILTLDSNQIIVALGIDPSSGKMLISTVSTWAANGKQTGTYKVMWYDGFSNKVIKAIQVEDRVTAFHSVGGLVLVGYGTKIGYLTGSGVNFLRQLQNVDYDFDELPWKHNFASISNTAYIVDGHKILAYGDITPGRKAFYYAYRNYIGGASTTNLSCVFDAGDGFLGFSEVETGEFYHLDTNSVGSIDSFDLYTNFIDFGRPIIPRKAVLNFLASTSSGNLSVNYQDERRSATSLNEDYGGSAITGLSIPFIFSGNNKAYQIQFRIAHTSGNTGLRNIIFYYDVVE